MNNNPLRTMPRSIPKDTGRKEKRIEPKQALFQKGQDGGKSKTPRPFLPNVGKHCVNEKYKKIHNVKPRPSSPHKLCMLFKTPVISKLTQDVVLVTKRRRNGVDTRDFVVVRNQWREQRTFLSSDGKQIFQIFRGMSSSRKATQGIL